MAVYRLGRVVRCNHSGCGVNADIGFSVVWTVVAFLP